MSERVPPPAAVVVGEPTQMAVVSGHKGVLKMTAQVRGKAVHSSVVDQGVSAVAYAARLAVWLDERMRRNRESGARDTRFDPPYTTLHSGIIEGGTAFNITASDCTLVSDIRTLPEELAAGYLAEYAAYAEELAAEMRAIDPAAGIEIAVECDVPGCREEPDGAAEALARKLTGDNGEHAVAYGTEAGQYPGRRPLDGGLRSRQHGPGPRPRRIHRLVPAPRRRGLPAPPDRRDGSLRRPRCRSSTASPISPTTSPPGGATSTPIPS